MGYLDFITIVITIIIKHFLCYIPSLPSCNNQTPFRIVSVQFLKFLTFNKDHPKIKKNAIMPDTFPGAISNAKNLSGRNTSNNLVVFSNNAISTARFKIPEVITSFYTPVKSKRYSLLIE